MLGFLGEKIENMSMTSAMNLQKVSAKNMWQSKSALGLLILVFAFPAWPIEPIPTFYQEPGFSPNRDYVNQHVSEHIDPFTGKLQFHSVDLFIPGNGGMDIKVQRSYNSINELLEEPTALGVGWTMSYGRVLRRAGIGLCDMNNIAQNAPVVELPDGSRQIMYMSLDSSFYISQNRWRADCSPTGTGMFVTSPDGLRYEMTTVGQGAGTPATGQQNAFYTTRIVDLNGNALNFTYVTVGLTTAVRTITASDGRQVTFNYSGNNLASISDGTRTWLYEYTYAAGQPDHPFLSKVTRPDGNTWQYGYNLAAAGTPGGNPPGTYSLSTLTYPTGGTFSYQYGFASFNDNLPRSTVVTRKTSQDTGGVWTYSYTPASGPGDIDSSGKYLFAPSQLDRTVITGPDGTHTYMHVGANSIGIGATYAIGLMVMKSLDSGYQNEYYSWDIQKISDTYNIRPGSIWIFDSATYAAVPAQKVIQRNGQVYTTVYSNYDTYGNARTISESGVKADSTSLTRVTTQTYDPRVSRWILHLPKTTSVDNVPGNVDRTYDSNGKLLTSTRYGVTTTYTYTAEGDIASKQDALGNTISYSSYYRGIPRTENHPEGVTLQRVVDAAGNITSQTDGEGVTTQYAYDGLNRLTSIVHPVGNPVSVTWLSNERQVQRGAYLERTLFDGYGRVSSVRHEGGSGVTQIVQNNLYDPLGRKIFRSYPNQATGTAIRYDVLGRAYAVLHVATPQGSGQFTNTGGQRTSYFQGSQISTVNENGNTFTNIYRTFGDPDKSALSRIVTPIAGANVDITRNGLDQVTQLQQGDKVRTSTYDTRYFLVQTTDPEVGTSIFGRDALGNMTTRQVGSSGVTSYAYDGRNRLTTVTYPSGTPSITKTYYRDDLAKSVDNGLARRDYVYGLNKMMSQESLTVDSRTLTAGYAYDANDALQSMTYGTGLALTYNPDPFGRPTQAAPFATAVSYFPSGQVQQMQYANGTVSNFGLNARQWPNAMTLAAGGGAQAFNMSYSYDNSGNVLNINETVRGLHNRTFGYDALDRITGVTLPNVTGQISYDGRGNILSQSIGATQLSYQYDPASDRLTTVSGSRNMSFAYDTYGNVTANSRNQFVYDDALNMRCVDCGTANEIRYVYDGAGMRVSEVKGGVTTYFMYGNGGNLLFEVDTNGVKREYGYVAGKNIAKKETR
jgi:YD repeat-containing protein